MKQKQSRNLSNLQSKFHGETIKNLALLFMLKVSYDEKKMLPTPHILSGPAR